MISYKNIKCDGLASMRLTIFQSLIGKTDSFFYCVKLLILEFLYHHYHFMLKVKPAKFPFS